MKQNYFFQMSMYVLNTLKESKDTDYITTSVTYSDTNPGLFLKNADFYYFSNILRHKPRSVSKKC